MLDYYNTFDENYDAALGHLAEQIQEKMKVYYYFLFRIHRFYTDRIKEKDIPHIATCIVSSLLIYFNLYTIYGWLMYKDFFTDIIPSKYFTAIPLGIIWILNYYVFIKNRPYLNCNFKKDIKGGNLILLYIVFTAVSSIIAANYNRDKIKKHNIRYPVIKHLKQRQSLEEKITDWWKHSDLTSHWRACDLSHTTIIK